jgi:putative acetyltransferase
MQFEIRPETPADAAAIEALTIAAFLNAPHTGHNEHFIINALRQAGKLTVSLVAAARDSVIGHVAISPVSISDGAAAWYGLGPVSVLPEHQGMGVGSRLIREALGVLSGKGAAGCVVLGEPVYYGRFGFRADPALVLAGVPPEYFQALEFRPSTARGTVVYHPAFAEV